MANLTRDRGQIILLAAFALALIFVSLALVVNSAIFSESLASQGGTTGATTALQVRHEAEVNVGEVIESANLHNWSSDSTLETAVKKGIENVSTQMARQQAATGALVSIAYNSDTDGVRIAQNSTSSSTFESADGAADYPVAQGVSPASGTGTRAFRINTTLGSLGSTNDTDFKVEVRDSTATGNTDTWRMNVWRPTGGEVRILVIKKSGGTVTSERCQYAVTDPVRIDVTGGTLDGKPCDALRTAPGGEDLSFASGAGSSYDIRFRNSSNIEGNFSMVVDDSATVPGTHVNSGPGGADSQPYETTALYSVEVTFRYDTADLNYETDIRVAPGEPDG